MVTRVLPNRRRDSRTGRAYDSLRSVGKLPDLKKSFQNRRQPRRDSDRGTKVFLAGMAVGAALEYLVVPDRGRRHRALTRDKIAHLYRSTPHVAATVARDIRNRGRGFVAETRALLEDEPVSDVILVERVRARVGRLVSHPGSIEVRAHGGTVVLSGPVLKHEVESLLSGVARVRGVEQVQSELQVHERGEHVPGLQGGSVRSDGIHLGREMWSPTGRLAAIVGGGAATITGMRMQGVGGAALTVTGVAFLLRGMVNLPLNRIFGITDSPRVVDVHKSIHVKAPVEDVFKLWTRFEDYPRFMQHVEEVRRLDENRLRWRVAGPAGTTVEWDADVIEMVPNELIAWQTTPDAAIQQEGRTRFVHEPDGTTRVDVHLHYRPPAGVLGHLVATAFGVDPRHSMQEDLVRMQSLFEHGRTTAHGETVTRDELMGESESTTAEQTG